MEGEDRSQTIAFLYKIIDDNQATIRFLDTKAGFGIAILGAIAGKVLLDQDELLAFRLNGVVVLALSIVCALFVAIAGTLGFRTVFPTVNPAENVSFPDNIEPKFFISKFNCCRFMRLFSSNRKFATLATTHAEYCAALRNANSETLESILAAEVLKLSFIRQLKTDRLSAFAKILIATVILFTALMVITKKANAAPQPQRGCPTTQAVEGPRDIYNFNSPQTTRKRQP